MPRVPSYTIGEARASHSLHASLQTVDKPHCNRRGFAHTHPTMLRIHLVYIMLGSDMCKDHHKFLSWLSYKCKTFSAIHSVTPCYAHAV